MQRSYASRSAKSTAVAPIGEPVDAAGALHANGLDGRRLLAIAWDVTLDASRRTPYMSRTTTEDLHSFLVEQGLRAAVSFDPARTQAGYSFASYLWDVMAQRGNRVRAARTTLKLP
jgi:hypothetical protein